jgi:archaellum component FlaG (FlaF/FlaG flagellin family)
MNAPDPRKKARSNLVLFAVHLVLAAACFAAFYYKVTQG